MQKVKYVCKSCNKIIPDKKTRYILQIQLFADGGVFEPDINDMNRDLIKEMKDCIALAKDKSEEELNSEIYDEFYFILCKSCRDEFYKKIKKLI
ncbi:MAG: hypothetical protein AB1765_11035 [Candidatus Hydrogenedentota bacterium]